MPTRPAALRWLACTVLAGLFGAALLGGALVAALDNHVAVAPPPEHVELTRQEAGLAPGRSDRLSFRPQNVSSRSVVQEASIRAEGGREFIEVRPYVLVKASLPPERREPAAATPPFDPIEMFAALGVLETDHNLGAETEDDDRVRIAYAPLDPVDIPDDARGSLDAAAVEELLKEEFGLAGGEPYGTPMHAPLLEWDRPSSSLVPSGLARGLALRHAEGGSRNSSWIAKRGQPQSQEVVEKNSAESQPTELTWAQLISARDPLEDLSSQLPHLAAFAAPGPLRRRSGPARGQQPTVHEALYEGGLRLEVPREVVDRIVQVLAFDVDFRQTASPGDSLEVFYSEEDPSSGDPPEILYAAVTVRGETRDFYRFRTPDDGTVGYYDEMGSSVGRFLMPKPLSGGTLRSGFGMRRHPILGSSRMHSGIDWAARTGTPVMAAGPGTMVEAQRKGALGNHVRIRHPNGYATSYSHMSAFADGIEPGARVRQGQIIGYVGSTGLSTGPHLHYEVMVDGRNIDPMRVRPLERRELEGKVLAAFLKEASRIGSLMQRARPADRTAAR